MKVKLDVGHFDDPEKNEYNIGLFLNALIEGYDVRLLVDTGASLSFLDQGWVKKHPRLKYFLSDDDFVYEVSATGSNVKSNKKLQVDKFKVGNRIFEQNFKILPLNIEDKDAYIGIIGMDFLAKHQIIIDCKNFQIIFKN